MGGFLFDEMIFGPVRSRRLGVSLGINLLPLHAKFCSYNCIYCECGWTKNRSGMRIELPQAQDLAVVLKQKLQELSGTDMEPDSITFAGNGEPTMHPEFAEIIDQTISLRNELAPKALVSVLSNGSMLHKSGITEALLKADKVMLKLDGGTEETIRKINMPLKAFRLKEYVKQLKQFNGKLIIQSLFLRGKYNGQEVDNTQTAEVDAWLRLLLEVHPMEVMIYAIERETPQEGLEKIPEAELENIAIRVRGAGLPASVFA